MGELSTGSVLLIAVGLTATWIVLFYSFTRNARYEKEVSQMNHVKRQPNRIFAENKNDDQEPRLDTTSLRELFVQGSIDVSMRHHKQEAWSATQRR